MNITEMAANVTPDEQVEVAVDYQGQCSSLTGRSSLTYQIGRLQDRVGMQFRIVRNTGKGMFCKDWAAVAVIDALLAKTSEVSARTFNEVHPGKSINTGGFILAVLKDLGVVKTKDDSRQHERVPGTSLQQAITFKLKEAAALEKLRKGNGG